MPKINRNDPCSCGSGNKAKHCCYRTDVPENHHEFDAYLPGQLISSILFDYVDIPSDRDKYFTGELAHLPWTSHELHVPLPDSNPHLADAINALRGNEPQPLFDAVSLLSKSVDTRPDRLRLAQTVLALRDEGDVARKLAAFAIIDLNSQDSLLFFAAVFVSLCHVAGRRHSRRRRSPHTASN